jgi:hypothetical protein
MKKKLKSSPQIKKEKQRAAIIDTHLHKYKPKNKITEAPQMKNKDEMLESIMISDGEENIDNLGKTISFIEVQRVQKNEVVNRKQGCGTALSENLSAGEISHREQSELQTNTRRMFGDNSDRVKGVSMKRMSAAPSSIDHNALYFLKKSDTFEKPE